MTCIFCKIISGEIPSSKIYEDNDVFAFLDTKPVNPGHTLVIPKKHFESIHDTPDEAVSKMIVVAKKIAGSIQKNLKAQGVTIGMNNGEAAGQSVFHAHIHVMPRYSTDTHKLWSGKDYKSGERESVAEKITKNL